MRYTVVWLPPALDDLAALWLGAADRPAITKAVHTLDAALRDDPDLKGLPFFNDRILLIDPLIAFYTVEPMDCLVEVIKIERRPD